MIKEKPNKGYRHSLLKIQVDVLLYIYSAKMKHAECFIITTRGKNKQTNWKGGGLVITDTKPRKLRFNSLRCGRGGAEII